MAFPYLFSASFDTGDNSEWDSEGDTGSLLDFPHYSTLGAIPGAPAPYRGAYCMRIQPSDTNDHTLTEGDIDIADAATRWVRFALFISTNFAATADDTFNIFEFQQAGGTVEASVGLRITGATDAVEIGIGDGTAPTDFVSIGKGAWHVIEVRMLVSTGTAGTLTLWVDGGQAVALTGLTHAAGVGQGVLGTQDTLATTNAGYLLFDEFAFDDTRLAITHRFAKSRLITTSSFLFMGPGRIDNVKLLDGGSNNVTCELYDTDIYNASLEPVWRDRTATANVTQDAADVPIGPFSRGCLAILGGTSPGAIMAVGHAVGWGSDGAVKGYAARRRESAI